MVPQLIIEQLLYYFLIVVPIINKTIYFRLFIFTKLSIKQVTASYKKSGSPGQCVTPQRERVHPTTDFYL